MICRYLAPEYVENGLVSVRTDVYAFGIVLLQLISGRKVISEQEAGQNQSLLQWVDYSYEYILLVCSIGHKLLSC